MRLLLLLALFCAMACAAKIPYKDMYLYDDTDQHSKRSPRKCMYDAMMEVDKYGTYTEEVMTPGQWNEARIFITRCISDAAFYNDKVKPVEKELVETIYEELVKNMKFHYHLKLDKVV